MRFPFDASKTLMNLFHPQIIKKAVAQHAQAIPEKHLPLLNAWRESIVSGAILTQKETALHGHFIHSILIELLGYTGFGAALEWNLQQEQQIGKGSVDVALGRFSAHQSDVIAPFELKGAKTKDLDAIMPGRHKSPVQQAWEYAMDAPGAKWVLVSNYVEVRLYAVGYGRQAYEVWKLDQLTDPQQYATFMLLLSAEHLLGGYTRDLLEESAKREKEITNALYQDYKALRKKLITTLAAENPDIAQFELIAHAQTILDRILFIAFAEDKGLLPNQSLAQAYTHRDPYNPRPIWENFKGLFRSVNEGNKALNIPAYNGGLFRPDALPETLRVSDAVCQAFKQLGEYDFASEVSVTILGHIFEQSITDLEALQAEASGQELDGAGKRKKEGVVYTPDAITRFIVEKALGGYLREQFDALWNASADRRIKAGDRAGEWKSQKEEIAFWRDYQERLRRLKVVDPACGSGAFLVAAFEFLLDEYNRVNGTLAELKAAQFGLFDPDREILTQNLYGVDINAESIEITKLSLWLKTAKYGKVLNSLDHNLRVGDSLLEPGDQSPGSKMKDAEAPLSGLQPALVGDSLLEPNDQSLGSKTKDAEAPLSGLQPALAFSPAIDGRASFRWKTAFPEVFEQGGFDVVLGNPPYVRQEFFSHLKPLLQKRYEVYNGVADLYTYFFERGLRLLKPNGKLGYISSSTFFKTGSGQNLRRYLAANATIEQIVDFGDMQVFEGVTTYPAILILTNATPDNQHDVRFLAFQKTPEDDLFKAFNAHAATMPQTLLNEESWRLEGDGFAQLRKRIIEGKKTLKELYGSPYRGILTGLNEAFVIDQSTYDAIIANEPQAKDILKPFLEGKDLKPWHVESRNLWLILFPKGWTLKHFGSVTEQEAWAKLNERFPQITKHLEPFAENAKKRGDKGDFWWELRACAYYNRFQEPKIIYGHFQPAPLFSFDTQNLFTNNKCYIFPNTGYFELGILQSHVIWFIFTSLTTMMRGGFYEATTQNIEKLPIPDATDAQKAAIADLAQRCQQTAEARYAAQEAVRRRIPDLCSPERNAELNTKLTNWWTLDFAAFRAEIKKCFKAEIPLAARNEWEQWLAAERTKIADFSHTLDELETELNRQVYALFALTPEEIRLIE